MLAVQERLHAALQQYYKYRGLYTASELSRMQVDSKNNAVQLSLLQQRVDEALTSMSEFLRQQLSAAGSKVEQMNQATVTNTTAVPTVEA